MKAVVHNNSFDFLRLLLAVLVVFSHSYHITGNRETEPLLLWSNGETDLGTFAVKGFFAISGYLVFASLKNSFSVIDFIRKRVLRIFPALIGLGIVSMMLIPLAYEGEIPIHQNRSYLIYPLKVLSLFQFQIFVDGVFWNHPMKVINTSLWTLPYEAVCYFLLSLLFFIRKSRFIEMLLSILFFILVFLSCFRHLMLNEKLFAHFNLFSYYFYDFAAFFIGGALISDLKVNVSRHQLLVVAVLAILCLCAFRLDLFRVSKYILLPPLFVFLGNMKLKPLQAVTNRIGDLSYGIYIYGFLIQQLVYYFLKPGVAGLFFISLPIIVVFAALSWHFIEKPALKLKNKRLV